MRIMLRVYPDPMVGEQWGEDDGDAVRPQTAPELRLPKAKPRRLRVGSLRLPLASARVRVARAQLAMTGWGSDWRPVSSEINRPRSGLVALPLPPLDHALSHCQILGTGDLEVHRVPGDGANVETVLRRQTRFVAGIVALACGPREDRPH